MDTARMQRVQEIFKAALDHPARDRDSVLQNECGADDDLRAEVESLLAVDERAPQSFMRPPESPSDREYQRPADHAGDWIGRKIGRYAVRQLIAAGGMGSVFLAEQESPRREVALKVLHAGMASGSILRRFDFETRILARLHHPHIAQIYESGLHENRLPFFAMEHIPGALPLTEYADHRELELSERLKLFQEVCDAVHYGHQRGVIHRDLKPGNILVDANGHAKVIDFGVARATDADVAVTTMHTDAGQIIGTLQYMSPEQCAADAQEIDTRTDVYSLGVVLFELVCGKLPYDVSHVTLQSAARIICEQSPAKPSQFSRAARGDVETIILKAMEKSRERRYQSVGQMVDDIRRHLAGEPIEARPPTKWTRTHRWIGRHPVLATTSLCLFVAVAIGIGTLVTGWFAFWRPAGVVVNRPPSEDNSILSVSLVSASVDKIFTWNNSEGYDSQSAGYIAFGYPRLLQRPKEVGGGRLALLGFRQAWAKYPDHPNSLVAFDVDQSLEKPVLDLRVHPDDALPDLHLRNYSADQFGVWFAAVYNVFPDTDDPEIVVAFKHHSWTQTILRIYDLAGNRLYEVWQDGYPESCHWLAGPGLLVFSGFDGSKFWSELGYDVKNPNGGGSLNGQHPSVVYALRPRRGFVAADLLRTTAGDPDESGLNPIWYLAVAPTRGFIATTKVVPPLVGSHDRIVRVAVNVYAGMESWGGPVVELDETGHEASRHDLSSLYREKSLTVPGGLPDKDEWKLVPYADLVAHAGLADRDSNR